MCTCVQVHALISSVDVELASTESGLRLPGNPS